MKKNGDCINIVWFDEGVSVGVGDNDQGYFFNENEWEMLNELLKPTRYSQETSEEKALNQIYELIASVRTNGAYPAESFVGGIIKDLLAKAQQEAVERERNKIFNKIIKELIDWGEVGLQNKYPLRWFIAGLEKMKALQKEEK